MVTDRHRIIVQGVHCQHHRIQRRVVAFVMKILEWRSLNRVARIEQQEIRISLARFFDECRDFCNSHVVVLVRIVVDWEYTSVHICRTQDGYVRAGRSRMTAESYDD